MKFKGSSNREIVLKERNKAEGLILCDFKTYNNLQQSYSNQIKTIWHHKNTFRPIEYRVQKEIFTYMVN